MGEIIDKSCVESLKKNHVSNEKDFKDPMEKVLEECKAVIKINEKGACNKKNNQDGEGKTVSQTSSLDQIVKDIKKILGQLKREKNPILNQRQTPSIQLKVEQKEFFKPKPSKIKSSKQNVPVQPVVTKPKVKRATREVSKNSLQCTNRLQSGTSLKSESLNAVASCRTIPITKAELRNFKHNVIINANAVLKNPEKLRAINKNAVANRVKNLMHEALVRSDQTHEVPVIDVGQFIDQSLNLGTAQEFSRLFQVAKSDSVSSRENSEGELSDHQDADSELVKPSTQLMQSKGQSKTTGNLIDRQKSPKSKQMMRRTNRNERKNVKTNNKNSLKSGSNCVIQKNSKQVDVVHVEDAMKTLSKNSGQIQRKDNTAKQQKPAGTCAPITSAPSQFSNVSSFNIAASSHNCFKRTKSVTSSSKPRFYHDPVVQLRDEVNRAIRDRKTFTVRGNFPAVRKALLRRGWVEKYHITNREKLQQEINSLKNRSLHELAGMLHVKEVNDICKKLIRSKLLGNHQVDLYWGPNYDAFDVNPDKTKLTLINKFRRDVFSYTSKQGLCDASKNAHWFNFPGLAHINHPRAYSFSRNGETKEFIKDFRRTAAISLLNWIIRSFETKEFKVISSSGKIPLEAFQFAANECYKMVVEANNQDIDESLNEALDHEWDQFLQYFYKILHIGNHFKAGNLETEESVLEKSKHLIEKLVQHYPHIKMDGMMNLWILKPTCGSQGRGIHICRTLQYIKETINSNKNVTYIAQKYIERPLLIFNTKFDIRQWFLISCAVPLTIWMYKECYLRFSSQTFSLRKLHESIHLTNNSVQQRYQNLSHDITLPPYNMWDSVQFRNYLSNIGYPDVWDRIIYKGMKECIVGAVMIHQDKIDKRKNCFELYGADFMLNEDFQPWLIEINSCPALYASTPITSKMCPQVLEDTIKVVVDYAHDPRCKTGNFELVYKAPSIVCNNNVDVSNLKLTGKHLPDDYFCLEEDKLAQKTQPDNLQSEKKSVKSNAAYVQQTLENLLRIVQKEKMKNGKQLTTEGTDPIEQLEEPMVKRCSYSSKTNSSLSMLQSQFEQMINSSDIPLDEEDVTLIDQALKMLKAEQSGGAFKYLLGIIERMMRKTNIVQ